MPTSASSRAKESGLVVLDVDVDKGGEESLRELEAEHGELPTTTIAVTGSGGMHYFFRHPGVEMRNSAGKLGAGLDVRGDGGYVVAAPSNHASGGHYDWLFSPEEQEPQTPRLAPRSHPEHWPARASPHRERCLGRVDPGGQRNARSPRSRGACAGRERRRRSCVEALLGINRAA